MSYGVAEAKTVGFVVVSDSTGMVAGHREDGAAWFCAAPVKEYATAAEAIAAIAARAIRLGFSEKGVTIQRVVERTVTSTERSYEAL